MRDASPDLLELLARLAIGDLDRVETQLSPFQQELAHLGSEKKCIVWPDSSST